MALDLHACSLCPRRCTSDRGAGVSGVCGETDRVRLARAALHLWEEPPISGDAGSGTVFFSGCPLKCVYCQNREISLGKVGLEVSVERLAQIFLEQQARGALNINLVTPTHFVAQIVQALDLARSGRLPDPDNLSADFAGQFKPNVLELPVVYNTSGYENAEVIGELKGYVDIFLTDFKYASPELAQKYSAARDYPQAASAALDAMYGVAGPYTLGTGVHGEEGVLQHGVVVRHLMLPGQLMDSKRVIDILVAKPYVSDICVSLMSQFTPLAGLELKYPELGRTVSELEYDELIDYALDLGIENSFMQEGGAAEESFIPSFDFEGVLKSS